MIPVPCASCCASTSIFHDLIPHFPVTRNLAFYAPYSKRIILQSSISADRSVQQTEVQAMFSISLIDRIVTSISPKIDRTGNRIPRRRDREKESDSFRKSRGVAAYPELDTYINAGDQEHNDPS